MKVVIAIDSFKGSLSSLEAGEAAKRGILKSNPQAQVEIRPLADGRAILRHRWRSDLWQMEVKEL